MIVLSGNKYLFFLLPVLFFSCGKEKNECAPLAIFDLGRDVRITGIEVLNDSTWVACGGIRGEAGYFFRTQDAGLHWTTQQTGESSCIYTIAFTDSLHGFAGGDFLRMWETIDGGLSWQFRWLADQVPYHEQDRPAIRSFCLNDDQHLFFCGGENLGTGVCYESIDAGKNWNFVVYHHEMRSIDRNPLGQLVAGGHGILMHSDSSIFSMNPCNWENDFITSLRFVSEKNVVAAGFNGGIYLSADAGNSWTESLKPNRPFHHRSGWNSIAVKEGEVIVAGKNGEIALSETGGDQWEEYILLNEPHLFQIVPFGNDYLVTGDHGMIYKIKL
ncbi:MAG: hypothetical protein IT223_03745 [Crocinitomicaceae bacterium]|nr:hypothetical protein [Crocinitomicaceae bacterium]